MDESNTLISRDVFVATKDLPIDYILGDNDVLCGRGSSCFNHVGNQRFRMLIATNLDIYSKELTKSDKTIIICGVVKIIRGHQGGFVKKNVETGLYFEVGDFHAVRYQLFEMLVTIGIRECESLLFVYVLKTNIYTNYLTYT